MRIHRCVDAGLQSGVRAGPLSVDGYLMLALIFSSWLMYPLVVSLIFPVSTRLLFLGFLFLLVALYFITNARLKLQSLDGPQKTILLLWSGYLIFLFIATLHAGSGESIIQFIKLGFKYAFFIFLLVFLKARLITASLSVYANAMILLVIAALVVMAGVATGTMQPIADVEQLQAGGVPRILHVYWGGFYGVYPILGPVPLYRVHSFCEEPGTFALALFPALYWFVIVKQAWFRAFLISMGIISSVSFGGFVALALSLPVLWLYRSNGKALLVFFFIFVVGFITVLDFARNPQFHGISYIAEKVQGESSSLGARIEQTEKVLDYVSIHPIGTGAGMGLPSGETVANGYAFAILQSGVIGGFFYIMAFLVLSVLSLSVLSRRGYAATGIDHRVRAVVALSVLVCIFFGMQRTQPDLSIWHMWLYASLFYIVSEKHRIAMHQ